MSASDGIALAAAIIAALAWLDSRRYTRAKLRAQQQASLYAERGDIRWDPVEYEFTIGNAGHGVARHVGLSLRAGHSSVGTDAPVSPLLPGEHRPLTFTMGRPLAHTEGARTPVALVAVWTDEVGQHQRVLLDDLPSGP